MGVAKTISISLPPDLLLKAQETAQRQNRSVNELLEEALQRYVKDEKTVSMKTLDELLERGQAHGRAIGITSEEDVDRILGEFRTQWRS